ncbi:MAG: ATP-binding cassette domain-containing protein [Balneolales bacterium]|nr:ATP-binding cassette domain-containing protein [Balneolales bacterium]
MEQEISNIAREATAALPPKPVIEVKNLRKGFDKVEVLRDLSLQLFENENLVVLGKSGSGKSVLIKCMVRLLRADAGTIRIFGENVQEMNDRELAELRVKIGFLFQRGALYDSMTIRENLEFPLVRIKKYLSRKEIDAKIEEALENVGLSDTINKMPSQLSGGMRKRASLARTIVVDPMIMLYDEPTTGLDPVTSDEISMLINNVKKKYNTSSVIITHDIACARATGDRVIMLNEGEVHMEGTIRSFEQSSDPLIQSFFKFREPSSAKAQPHHG